jgi:hypothetical protein
VVLAGHSQQLVSLKDPMLSKQVRKLICQNSSFLTVSMDQASKAINVEVDMSMKQ